MKKGDQTGVWRWMAAAAAALLVGACGGNDTPLGTVRVALTDAPSCGFDEVNVTVSAVRIHASQTADDNSSGWEEITLTPPRKIDLLSLNNGILEELGQRAVPAGQYTQTRLVLQPNRGNTPLANSVVPTGGVEEPLDTPSGTQTGIKLIRPFTVPEGGLADLVLDFDACKSVVLRGNGTYGLKPVVSVSMRVVAEVVGFVDTSVPGMQVSAQSNGTVLRSTVPDATGAFKLAFLDPVANPQVNVVFVAPGRATAVIGAVPIVLQGTTRVSTSTARISLPTSQTRTAGGTALPAAAIATVRALQAVSTVPKVEVASTNVDLLGGYTLTLPIGDPLFAPFGTGTLPLTFTPQPATAARYTLEASADGYVTQSSPEINLTSANATVNFTLTPAP